jgi:hypothetical protein
LAHHAAPRLEDTQTTLDGLGSRVFGVSAAIGVIGLAATVALGMAEGDGWRHFSFSYLVSFAFFLAISLGALFFVPLQYLVKASWSIVVRRMAEVMAAALPLFLLLGVPVVVLASQVYGWAGHEAGSPLLAHKATFLSPTWFSVRWLINFAVWTWLGWTFWRGSLRQDASGDVKITGRLENLSGFALLVYALTVALAAFDLLMSIDPIWFSTIFGVYYFAGGLVSFYAVLTLVTMGLQSTGRLRGIISAEHFHDYGKLMFAFTFFWAYIAFSQYMLYWYANIPEETAWYLLRSQGGWGRLGLAIVFVAFALPFAGLISRFAKRNRRILAFWAVWIIVAQWLNLYWVVMPEFSDTFVFGAMDVTAFLGIGGLWLATVTRLAMGRSLVPVRDPRLDDSLRFENA